MIISIYVADSLEVIVLICMSLYIVQCISSEATKLMSALSREYRHITKTLHLPKG